MNDVLASGGTSGLSVHHLVLFGFVVCIVLVLVRRLGLALLLAVPTLMLAGVDNLTTELGSDGASTTAGPTPRPASPATVQPTPSSPASHTSHHHSAVPWTTIGLVTVVAFAVWVLACALLIYRRGRAMDGDWRDWDDLADESVDPYPDLPSAAADHSPLNRGTPYARNACARLARLAREFLGALAVHGGEPIMDTATSETLCFIDAFTLAIDLVARPNAEPEMVSAALDEAERRWILARVVNQDPDLDTGWNIPDGDTV